MPKIKWLGKQENCDICKDTLGRFNTFYDGRLKDRTAWALMCKECWQYYGAGLGTGIGQEFDIFTKEKIRG